MNIDGIGLESAQQSLGVAQNSQQLDKDAFTQLLVTQLRNQDPLSPQTNEELAAQLAQFSSLEQMELVNENLVGMTRLNQSNALVDQITGASAMVGQSVAYLDPETGATFAGEVEYAKVRDGLVYLGVGGNDVPVDQITEILGVPESEPSNEEEESKPENETDTTDTGA